jgi:hypothetical protein
MTFILSADRTSPEAMSNGFRRYADYLLENRKNFPASAYALATSDWFYNFNDHRCPHDAWLESFSMTEPSSGSRNEQRIVSLRIRLLAAHHDGMIELHYPQVYGYRLDLKNGELGHRDWRYDEFRLSDSSRLIHEIEWYHMGERARWFVEADDVLFSWQPFDESTTEFAGLRLKR